jgi:N utilization substance protein B
MSRRSARELSMRVLFDMHMNNDFNLNKIEYHLEQENINRRQNDYIYGVLTAAVDNLAQIDKIIENYSKGWKLDRIANVDLAILRLALCEILYMEDISYRISINEAIELAKIYGSDETPSFINGILGKYVEDKGLKNDEQDK